MPDTCTTAPAALRIELESLEAETFEIQDFTEVGEELMASGCCSTSSTSCCSSCTSCSSTSCCG